MSTECQSARRGDQFVAKHHGVRRSARHGKGRDKALMKEGASMWFVRRVLPCSGCSHGGAVAGGGEWRGSPESISEMGVAWRSD